MGTSRPSNKSTPEVWFTCCGDYPTGVNDLAMHLMNLLADVEGKYVQTKDAGKFGIQARETEQLRRNLSVVMQNAIGYRKLEY